MANLSEHFTLAEMIKTGTGLSNVPGPKDIARLRHSAERMEEVRDFLGHAVEVNSGYRCAAVNHAVGGSPTSDHMAGDAVDFTCKGFGTPFKIAVALAESGIKFDQLIQEGTWVHISFGPRMRQQCLTKRVIDGKLTYLPGVQP